MQLNAGALKNTQFWENAGISLPKFDRDAMIAITGAAPKWIHFGAGNIFRAYIADIAQSMLDKGLETAGIIAVGGKNGEIIDKCFSVYDNLSILVTLKSDGTTDKKVVASVAQSLKISRDFNAIKKIFSFPSLQIASFTITEKGYNIRNQKGFFLPEIIDDITQGPEHSKSYFGCITAVCYERYNKGAYPLAMISMDNCSQNGTLLFSVIETIAEKWVTNGLVSAGFLDYIRDKNKITFPWTMIDKITPAPDEKISGMLASCGLENMQVKTTVKNSLAAPFVNAEETGYLVMEDIFPNGRPALEKAGVLFTNRETVEKAEKMKVSTCINPLHTSLAVFGILLGFSKVNEAIKDKDLLKLLEGIGYSEGLPVVTDPGIINPKEFIDKVIKDRLPNPFMPDTLSRIATDSSCKIPIRFGETLKAYIKEKKDCSNLKFIPLVFAGWLRYLLGVDDQGIPYKISPDPNLETLKNSLGSINLGQNGSFHNNLEPILSNFLFFGVNLYEAGLGEKVEDYFSQMITGKNAVKKTLTNVLNL